MTSKVTYLGNLSTEAVHLKSGSSIRTDAPTDNRGKGEAFSPTDLMATSLASCILTIMGIKALDNNIDMNGATAEVLKVMGSAPRRIIRIEVVIQMPSNGFSDRDKKLLEKAAHHCPVANSINPELEEVITINW